MKYNINLNKALICNYIIISLILLYNLYFRFITLRILTEYEKIFILFIFTLIIICSFYVGHIKTFISFVFGFSFFLFGFRPYDVQSQIFEALVLLVTIFYFFNNFSYNNSIILNKYLKKLFILFLILSIGSLLLLPIKYILYNIFSLGKEWYLYQIINVHPNSYYYPINGINTLVLYFVFSLCMARNSVKTFTHLFLGIFLGGLFCSIIGLFEYYGLISLTWYSHTVSDNVLSSTFLSRGWLAEYLLMITPFILIIFISAKSIYLKIILFGMLILLELTLILVGARAAWVTYPIVLLFCWIFLYFVKDGKIVFSKISWYSYIKILVSVPITILISLIVLFYIVFPLAESNTRNSNIQSGTSVQYSKNYIYNRANTIVKSDGRFKVWMQGIDAGMESPFFGLGYDTFAWHTKILSKIPESLYSRQINNKFTYLYDTPHNLYIHLFVNGGVVSLIIWLAFILYCLLLLLYDLVNNHKLINIPIIISILIFHTYGIFQSMQYVPMIWFFIFICIAYCLRISNDVLPQLVNHTVVNTNKYVLILVLIGLFSYINNFESKLIAHKYNLNKYEYDQLYNKYMGFYPVENWNGVNYRWTGRNAEIKLNYKGRIEFNIQYHNVKPDFEPAELIISIDDKIIETVTMSEKSNIIIKNIILDLGETEKEKILGFSISRTWSPKNYGINDERILGVAVSDIKPVKI